MILKIPLHWMKITVENTLVRAEKYLRKSYLKMPLYLKSQWKYTFALKITFEKYSRTENHIGKMPLHWKSHFNNTFSLNVTLQKYLRTATHMGKYLCTPNTFALNTKITLENTFVLKIILKNVLHWKANWKNTFALTITLDNIPCTENHTEKYLCTENHMGKYLCAENHMGILLH